MLFDIFLIILVLFEFKSDPSKTTTKMLFDIFLIILVLFEFKSDPVYSISIYKVKIVGHC